MPARMYRKDKIGVCYFIYTFIRKMTSSLHNIPRVRDTGFYNMYFYFLPFTTLLCIVFSRTAGFLKKPKIKKKNAAIEKLQ